MSALTNVDVTQRPQNPFKHLLGIDDHIAALDIFNEVRIKLFGIKLQNGWRKILKKNCWKHQRKLISLNHLMFIYLLPMLKILLINMLMIED